jgi:hypothetical protein
VRQLFSIRTPVVSANSCCFLQRVRPIIQCVPLATEPGIFLNNSNTNEDIATKFEQEYVRCVRNEDECVCSAPNCCDTEQRSKYAGFDSEWDTL